MKTAETPAKDWRMIFLFTGSLFGSLHFFAQALALFVFWLVSFAGGVFLFAETIPLSLLAWSSILSGVLLIPVVLHSFFRMRNMPLPKWLDLSDPRIGKWAMWVILLWPLFVLLGWLVVGQPSVAGIFLGSINLIVAGLPILWIYRTAQRDLKARSQLRQWTIFGFSLTVIPVIVILVELAAFLVLALAAGIWIGVNVSQNPQLERELMYIVNQFLIAGQDMDALVLLLKPYILQPTVIFWVLAIFGGIMPMIEEIVKPLAIWTLAGRRILPQEGFVSGLLCGAGFALMENVLYFSIAATREDWLFMAIGRAGTGVLHMLASGLMGWGLARAWQNGKWQFLGLTSLGAFLLHGIWNVVALVVGMAPLFLIGPDPTFWQTLLFHLPIFLLLGLSLLGMILVNRHLRKAFVGSLYLSEGVQRSDLAGD